MLTAVPGRGGYRPSRPLRSKISRWSLHACRYAISRSPHNAVRKAVATATVKALVAAVAASGIDIVYADTFIARGSNSLPQCSRMMR